MSVNPTLGQQLRLPSRNIKTAVSCLLENTVHMCSWPFYRLPAAASGWAPIAGAFAPVDSAGTQGETVQVFVSPVSEPFSLYQGPAETLDWTQLHDNCRYPQ